MKFRKRYIYLGAAILILIGTGLYAYWKLEPSSHFRHANIPVLATPDQEAGQLSANHSRSVTSGKPVENSANQGNQADKRPAGEENRVSFNILFLGTDARDQEASRTDVIMLAHVNPDDNRINLISIPRDTRVKLPDVGYTKINHAHVLGELDGGSHSGTEAAIQAVSNLCSCSINYYMKTNFEGFEHFIDTLGGLDVHLDNPVKLTYAYKTLPAGDNHLSGAEALDLVRERKSLPGGDSGRQANQAMVLKEIVRTVIKPQNLKNLPSLIHQVREDILDTNLSDSDLISLALIAKDLKEDRLRYVQVPGHSGKAWDPLVKNDLYYWMPDLEAWAALSEELLGE